MQKVPSEGLNWLANKREAAVAGLGIFIVDSCFANHATSLAGASFNDRLDHLVPSAFAVPEVTDDIGIKSHEADLAFAIGTAVIATDLVKRTSSTKELVAIAAGAQVLSTAADGVLAETHLLSTPELSRPDVGFSAIGVAFVSKFLLDRIAETENKKHKQVLVGASAIAGALVTFGASYIDSKNGGTNLASHSAGIGVGAAASGLKHKSMLRLPWRARQALGYDAAAETLAT